jgi:hypothetical protein
MGCASSVLIGHNSQKNAPQSRNPPTGRRNSESGTAWTSLIGNRLQRRGSRYSINRTIKVESANNRFGWQGVWEVPSTLFADASDDCCQAVAEHLELKCLRSGETLFQQGDAGTSMFFINQGRVRVLKNSKEIAELGVGQYIGELGLMLNDGRTATIIAIGADCQLLELSREDFYQVSPHSHPEALLRS